MEFMLPRLMHVGTSFLLGVPMETNAFCCAPSFKVKQVPYSPGYKHVGI
jgi:hypothetical protein